MLAFSLLLLASATSADGQLPGPTEPRPAPRRDQSLHVGATWGQLVSSQLTDERPTAFWNLHMNVPLAERWGVSTQLRMDNIVFGSAEEPASQLVHPGRTDYSIGLRLLPNGSRLGVEAHHISSHAVASLHERDDRQFEPQIQRGGVSNFGSLLLHDRGRELRLGYGALWTDTNTAGIFLEIEGFLLNSRSSRGPFATARLPVRLPLSLRGHVAALAILDAKPLPTTRARGDVLSWGAVLHRPLGEHWVLGFSYLGNNGAAGHKRADNSAAAFLRLRLGLR